MQQTKEQLEAWSANIVQDIDEDIDLDDVGDNLDDKNNDLDVLQPWGEASSGDGLERQVLGSASWSVYDDDDDDDDSDGDDGDDDVVTVPLRVSLYSLSQIPGAST